jgi:hypothetical protein
MFGKSKKKTYYLADCINHFLVWRFLSGHPSRPFGLNLCRFVILFFLSWLLANALLLVANTLLSQPFVPEQTLSAINTQLASDKTGLSFIQINAVKFNLRGAQHEAIQAQVNIKTTAGPASPSNTKTLLHYDLVARDHTPLWFFGQVVAVSSEISLEALIKCYDRLSSQSIPDQPKASEQDIKAYSEKLRTVLIDDKYPKPDQPGYLPTSLSFLEEPFGNIAIERRINGYIQFFAIWGFSMFVVLAILRFISFSLFQKRLLCVTHIDESEEPDAPWRQLQGKLEKLNEKLPHNAKQDGEAYDNAFVLDAKALAVSYERVGQILERHRCFSAHVSLMRQALVASLTEASRAANIPAFVAYQTQILSTLTYEAGTLLRFLVWVVPTVGFVGTVFGISHTLQITSLLDSSNEFVKISGKSLVNTAIAVAFDSTFVSLVLSIIAMLWQQSAASHEEEMIQSQADYAISTIATAANAQVPNPVRSSTADPQTSSAPEQQRGQHSLPRHRRARFAYPIIVFIILLAIAYAVLRPYLHLI